MVVHAFQKKKKILKAIELIQSICTRATNCARCPFSERTNGVITCLITKNTPENWIVNPEIIKDVENGEYLKTIKEFESLRGIKDIEGINSREEAEEAEEEYDRNWKVLVPVKVDED